MKTTNNNTLMTFSLSLLIIIICVFLISVNAEASLIVKPGNPVTIASNENYPEIIVKNGGKLIISGNNITLKTGNFVIESGGTLTYHSDYINKSLSLTIDATDVRISGDIDFKGLDGADSDKADSFKDGANGENGKNGKNITIKAEGRIEINGKINTSGGKGGKGGNGGDDDKFFETGDPGKGGKGGDGGKAGELSLYASTIVINKNGKITANGGAGGNGGEGGDPGDYGRGADGGKGGNGGNAGSIIMKSNYFSINGLIESKGGGKGNGGSGTKGGWVGGGNGKNGDPGGDGTSIEAKVYVGYYNISGDYNQYFQPKPVWKEDKRGPQSDGNFDMYILENNKQLRNNIIINNKTPFIKWSELKDEEYDGIPPSGVKEYIIYLDNKEIRRSSETQVRLPSLSDGEYKLQISAVDNNKNVSERYPRNTFNFEIDTVAPTIPYIKEIEIAEKQIKISWNKSNDKNGISCYELNLFDVKTGQLLKSEKVLDSDINQFELKFDFKPNQNYGIRIRAVDVAGNASQWSEQEFITLPASSWIIRHQSGWDKGLYINLEIYSVGEGASEYRYIREKLDNGKYVTDYISDWFSSSKPVGDTFIIADRGGELVPRGTYRYFIETRDSQGKNIVRSNAYILNLGNNKPEFQGIVGPRDSALLADKEIKLRIKPFLDVDGDKLSYTFVVEYEQNGEWFGLLRNSKDLIISEDEVSFLFKPEREGLYRWWVEVTDSYDTVYSPVSQFTVDYTPPEISFKVYDSEGQREVSAINQEKILIKEIKYGDEIFRLEFREGDYLLASFNGPFPESVLLELSPDEGSKELKVIAYDQAGNFTEVVKDIILDKTPPGKPEALKISAQKNQLEISWKPANDKGKQGALSGVSTYILSYQSLERDKSGKFVIEEKENLVYLITDLWDNEEIEVEICAVDNAGNIGEAVKDIAYPLAERGVINGFTFNSAETYQEYSVVLDIKEVRAAEYRIIREQLHDGELINRVVSEWLNIDNLQYVDDNLQAHAVYYYKIETRNQDGIQETGFELENYIFEVPNQLPGEPLLVGYDFVNNLPLILKARPVIDPDGDNLYYYFFLKDNKGNILVDFEPGNMDEGLSYQYDGEFESGQILFWQVAVTDGFLNEEGEPVYVYSREVRTIIDQDQPIIRLVDEIPSDYVSDLALEIIINDEISGLMEIEYYWNQEDLLPTEREKTIISNLNGLDQYNINFSSEIPEGENNLYISVLDRAGNESKMSIKTRVDRTPPELYALKLNGQRVDGTLYTTNRNSVAAEWKIKEDYTGMDYYYIALLTEEEIIDFPVIPTEKFVVVDEDFRRDRVDFAHVITAPLQENAKYHIVVEGVNTAGLSSGPVISEGIVIDSRSPVIEEIELHGLKENNEKYYCNNLMSLNLELSTHDNGGSGVKEINYALVDNLQLKPSSIEWQQSLEQLFSTVQPDAGKEYFLAVQVIDNLDQYTIGYSEGFIYANTPPEIKELFLGSPLLIDSLEDIYHSRPGISIPVTLVIEDKVALDSISYGVGSKAGLNDILDWTAIEEVDYVNYTKLDLELGAGTYYVNIRVENRAGLVSTASSNPLRIVEFEETAPFVGFSDKFTTNRNQLQFYWEFSTDMKVVAYQYRLVDREGTNLIDWQHIEDRELKGSYIIRDINLENGEEYFVCLRAVYQDGTYSPTGVSQGITVDITPAENLFINDGSYISGNNLYLEWGAEDPESSIKEYRIKIGKEPGADDVSSGYILLDRSGSTTIRNLEFEEGEIYYTTLEVINGANLISEICSNGFRVDNTPPPVPRITTESKYVNEFKLRYDWRWSQEDPESGLQEYQVAMLTNREVNSATEWTTVGKETELIITDNLLEGQWYYLAVKAVNQAGLSSVAYSEPVMIDTTAPTPPRIDDGGGYVLLDDSGLANLTVSFASTDDESGVSHYLFSFGTDQDWQKIIKDRQITEAEMIKGEIELRDLLLIPGEVYFFTVQAIDKAGLVSMESRSTGIMAVSGYPVITDLNDYGDYNSFSDQIIVSWTCTETGFAPIDYFEIRLSTDLSNWIYVKDVREEQVIIRPEDIDLESFVDGEIYYISVRGVNKAGIKTPAAKAGITDGIRIDNTPPEDLKIVFNDTHSTERFKIHLEANDPHSGIAAYRFAVGSTVGGSDLSGGWIVRETGKSILEEYLILPLKHRQAFYMSFQARNRAGLWSEIVSSEKAVIADLAPPEIIEFNADRFINLDRRVSFNWKAIDPETGITAYRYQLMKKDAELDWEDIPVYYTENEFNQVEFTVTDGEVQDGEEYRLVLQVKNRLNLWSESVEQILLADFIKPVIIMEDIDELVTNDGLAELNYSVSEIADINLSLYRINQENRKELISTHTIQKAEPGKELIYRFDQREMLPSSFLLELEAIDLAGNCSDVVEQLIRINAKPQVDLGIDRSQYKGRELKFTVAVNDPDGEIVSYLWDFGDGNISREISPVHVYQEIGTYIVTLSCIDNDGGIGTDQIKVVIGNTLEGELVLDEVWSGDMELRNTVIVPAGVTLYIEAGANIVVPVEKALIINGSLKIMGTEEERVHFNSSSQKNWHGIKINPQSEEIDLQYAVIENALRGIAFIECGGKVDNLIFRNNQHGIHLYQAYPEISNSRFVDNAFFGIKEDGDCSPILIDNVFLNNRVGDYYHSRRTILSGDALEELNKSDMEGD